MDRPPQPTRLGTDVVVVNRAEVLALIDEWAREDCTCGGVAACLTCQRADRITAALAAQEGERGGAEVAAVRVVAASLCNCVNRDMSHHGPLCPTGKIEAALADPAGALATHDAEVLRAFAEWVSSQKAYNGADRAGQALYDYGLNVVLRGWAEEWLEAQS